MLECPDCKWMWFGVRVDQDSVLLTCTHCRKRLRLQVIVHMDGEPSIIEGTV